MTTSRKVIAANRMNSRKSTGPKTLIGKAASRLNSLQHGVFAAAPLLPGEDASEFTRLRQSYIDLYAPANPTENFLVNRIVLAAWRVNRLAMLEVRVVSAQHNAAEDHASLMHDMLRLVTRLHSPQLTLDDHEVAALPDLETDRAVGRAPSAKSASHLGWRDPVARAYMRDSEHGNTIFKLAHYQTSLERSFYRAVGELERLRAREKGD